MGSRRQACHSISKMPLPFGPQFVSGIVNRTHTAQDQEECLLAAGLVIKAQRNAKMVKLEDQGWREG